MARCDVCINRCVGSVCGSRGWLVVEREGGREGGRERERERERELKGGLGA